MDGNRRWAEKQGLLKKYFGHNNGLDSLKNTVSNCIELNIKYMTFWALSTENWKNRTSEEVKNIFKILIEALENIEDLTKNKARFETIGNIEELPLEIQQAISKAKEKTKNNNEYIITIGLNYGGIDEISRVIAGVDFSHKSKEEIIDYIQNNLDTKNIPDPELIIRTGGDVRTSGFMIWQSAYSEWYFTDTLWPDFDMEQLKKAIEYFHNCKRNFGK